MTASELLNYGYEQLGSKNPAARNSDARILLEHCLKLKPAQIYLSQIELKQYEITSYKKTLGKRKTGQPTAYITGETEFMGLKFFVNRDVLIPRQETENMVEEAIRKISGITGSTTVLDIATGSGNIAISLAKQIPHSRIIATDISKKALRLAEKNAKANGVSGRITFLQNDILNPGSGLRFHSFDLVISNPPYIKTGGLKILQKEILHEPEIALDGGKDGLKFYGKIISLSARLLKKNGYIFVEIGHSSKKIKKYMETDGFSNIEILKDYLHQERIIYGQNCN